MKGEYEKKESSTKKKNERINMKMVMFSSIEFLNLRFRKTQYVG